MKQEQEEPQKPPTAAPSRKDRPTNSVHFGDSDFDVEDDYGDATWEEVCTTCCCHTFEEWLWIALGLGVVCFFLYFFLFGLELLGSSAKVMTGCAAGALFGDDTNPIAGLMVGILATVLLQSSSTTTSIIVSLVGSAVSVNQGIYMIMGANIGTSVTNTIVAMGQMGDGDQLERAFGGATVHDMFNFMAVAILLPVEVITGYLARLTGAIVKNAEPGNGEKWEGPVKKLVAPLGKKIIIANKKLIKGVAKGASCQDFYPINCTDNVETYTACKDKTGLIDCNKKDNSCPAFFQHTATASDDKVSGGVVFVLAIFILFVCLLGLVTVLQKMLLGMSSRIVYKATDVNGYIAIIIGAGLTMAVQSSSVTTSTLTPLVGLGIIRLEQMYPLTLGANIGTTVTAILASMVSEGLEPLQVALAHLFFNITGIIIWYPVPYMRRIPLHAARQLGRATRVWRGFPLVYIAVMFFALPILFLGISALFTQGSIGMTVLGSFITIILGLLCIWAFYWCQYRGGKQTCADCMTDCERRRLVSKTLPDDMQALKTKVNALVEHTGLVIEDYDDNDETGEDATNKTAGNEVDDLADAKFATDESEESNEGEMEA